MSFDARNVFPNQHGRNALWGVLVILVVWLLVRHFSKVTLPSFMRRRSHVTHTTNPVVNPSSTLHSNGLHHSSVNSGLNSNVEAGHGTVTTSPAHVHRNDEKNGWNKNLHELFTWMMGAWIINMLANTFTDKLAIWFLVTSAVGLVWAFTKKFIHRISPFDFLLLILSVGITFLYFNAITDIAYGNAGRY